MLAPAAGGIRSQSWQANLLELESQLAASKAKWKLVFGHHPVRFASSFTKISDLLGSLEPVLERYKVQAYFCGHEHNLQYLHVEGGYVHYIISGGGSHVQYPALGNFSTGTSSKMFRDDSGLCKNTTHAHVYARGTKHTLCKGSAKHTLRVHTVAATGSTQVPTLYIF